MKVKKIECVTSQTVLKLKGLPVFYLNVIFISWFRRSVLSLFGRKPVHIGYTAPLLLIMIDCH